MKRALYVYQSSPCKAMGIFPDTQGQLTLQSDVISGRNLNSVENLWLSLLLAKNEEDAIKMKALEWPQSYMLIFQTFKGI